MRDLGHRFHSLHFGHPAMDGFLRFVEHYGLLSIFLSMVIENCGIPFPTEGAFLVGQRLIQTGRHSFWFVYVFITVAQVIGAVLAYFIGRWLGSWLGRRFAHHEGYQKASKSVVEWYKKYGSVTVLGTRVIGYVRPWSSLIAGAADFPFAPFFLWTVIGTLLFVYPTMHVTALLFLVWQRLPALHLLISLGFFITFFGVGIYAWLKRKK